MKWLLVLAIVLGLRQQPAEAPKDKGAAETNRTKCTAHAKNTERNQTPSAQATPVPAQMPVATESQRSATTANDHTRTSQQTSNEDRSTQRKLTWFTGVLAVVGMLQLVVMFLTWLIYRRQAREMRRQRLEMRRQRHVMFRQWRVMGEQARLTAGQLAEMARQSGILTTSVQAAKATAESARDSIEIVISKERARLRIDLKQLDLKPKPFCTDGSRSQHHHACV